MTLNNLILIFQDIAKRHKQVNDFACSQDFNIATEEAPNYPIFVVNPTGANLPKTDNGYSSFVTTFDFQCIDLVCKDNSNRREVLSDTMQIINDCIAQLNSHPYYIENSIGIINNISFDPLRGKYDEDVDGWKISIELEHPNKVSWCGSPMKVIDGFLPPAIDTDVIIENSTGSFRVVASGGTTKILADEQLQLVDVNDNVIESYTNPLYEDRVIEVPVFGDVKSGIAYQRPLPTGQTISYRIGDDAWQVVNNPYNAAPTNPLYTQSLVDFFTLNYDNAFGNRFRFTDELGNDAILNENINVDYCIDNLTGLAWGKGVKGISKTFEEANDESINLTYSGYNDWYLPNINELYSLVVYQKINFNNLPILNIGVEKTRSSTTNFQNTSQTYHISSTQVRQSNKTELSNYYPIRQHF